MTRKEFSRMLVKNIKPNAELHFYVSLKTADDRYSVAELSVLDATMTADVDEPNVGGIIFDIAEIFG